MKIKINNANELIEFINREDVSIPDAEKITNKCFDVDVIDFTEGKKTNCTKSDLIDRVHEYLKPLTHSEIKQGFKIYWH
jgi:hypothetical protein